MLAYRLALVTGIPELRIIEALEAHPEVVRVTGRESHGGAWVEGWRRIA